MQKLIAAIVCLSALFQISADNYTVYYQNSRNWQEVACRVWSGNDEKTGEWPCKNITHAETVTHDGITYLKFEVEEDDSSCQIIFNNGGSGARTASLPLVDGAVYNADGKVSDSLGGADVADGSVMQPTGTLPVIYINCTETGTNGQLITDYNLKDKDYRSGTYWIDAMGIEGFENIGSADAMLPLEIKARGNYTRSGFAKKPFKLKLGKKASPLGLTNSKHFALLNHSDDDTGYLRNFVGFWLGRAMYEEDSRMWCPREIPVEVVINGDYRGIYFLAESIRVDADRVNIPELEDNCTDQAIISGGYLVELDNYYDDATIKVYGDENTGDRVWVTPDTPEVYSPIMTRFIADQFSTMTNLIKGHDADIWKYLDVDAAARYYLIMEVLSHWEAYHGSTYLYRDRGDMQKWIFSPLWDMGHAFDSWGNDKFLYASGPNHYGNTWIADMAQTPGFMDKVKANWQWFWGNKVGQLYADIDTYIDKIAQAAVRDHERWQGLTPEFYYDSLNHNSPNNPTEVADNSNIQERKVQTLNNLQAKINWLSGQWGTPQEGIAMPEADMTPAQPLPDYMKPDYVPTEGIIYYKSNPAGKVDARIWIWSDSGDYFSCGWADRPYMTEGTDSDGETYYWYKYDGDLTNPKFQITEGSTSIYDGTPLVSGTLYIKNSSSISGWSPNNDEPGPGPDPQPESVVLYLYDKAGWCSGDETPTCYVYADGLGDNGWNTCHMTRMPDGTAIGDYTSTADKAIFSYTPDKKFQATGLAMFYKDNSHRYPADGAPGMSIGGVSHIFVNDDSHTWSEVVLPVDEPWSGTLPVLYISTADGNPVPADKSPVAGTAYIDNKDSGAGWSVGSEAAPVAVDKIKGHGSTTWTDFEKKPYKLQFNKKQTFGTTMPESKHYLLMPYAADGELDFLRNIAGHEIAKAMGLAWTPGQTPVEVVLNGEYLGLYFLVENIRPAGARVQQFDFGDLKMVQDNWRNWIVEVDNTKTTEADKTISDGKGHDLKLYSDSFDFEDPDWAKKFPEESKTAMLETVRSDFDALTGMLENTLSDLAAKPVDNAYWMEGINRHEAARYCLVQELMDDPNAFTTAFYMTYTAQDPDGNPVEESGWSFGPVWDFSHSFATRGEKSSLLDGYENVPLAGTLYACDDFFNLMVRTYRDFTAEQTATETPRRAGSDNPNLNLTDFPEGSRLKEAWDNVEAQYAKYQPALENEYARWQGAYASGAEALSPSDGSALQTVKDYLLANHSYLTGKLSDELPTAVRTLREESSETAVEYFDMTGRRIQTPTPGSICIRRQGSQVSKLVVR